MWSSMSRDDIPVPMDLSQSLVLADSMEGDELVNSAYSHSLNASQVDLTVDGDGTGASKMIIDDEDLESDGFEDEHLAIRSNLFDGCLLDPQQLQVVKEIGEGAFSTIFLAKMSQTGELVAVKKANIQIKSRFPPEVMFCREVEFLKDLRDFNHPNIIRLVGACRGRDFGMVAVEFVPGGSLSLIVHERRVALQLPHMIQIGRGICNGMRFLHLHGIIHRDLTSENVLLKNDGVCKIIDFGFAVRVADASPDKLYRLRPAGNARWRAPEMTQRLPYSSNVDVYSFGIILNELLSKERPFSAVIKSRDVAQLAVAGERPPMSFIGLDNLRSLIAEAWHQNAALRPSFAVLLKRLTEIFEQLMNT